MSDNLDEPIDPGASTSLSLGRATFVGLSATAAVAGSVSAAIAAPVYGKPHAPIVPEDDPAIVVFRPLLQSTSRLINSYAAVPKEASPTTPAIVVTMAIWGVDAQLRDTVRRFAKAGYVAIAPDLYSAMNAPSGDGNSDSSAFRPLAQLLVESTVNNDLASGAAWTRSRLPGSAAANAKVGIIGFCMGGALALRQTIVNAQVFNSASIFYGNIAPFEPANVKVPVIGSYGERDTSIPAANVRAFYPRVPYPHDLKIYDEAGHAFFDDTRQSYVPGPAADAWKRTLDWFGFYLKR